MLFLLFRRKVMYMKKALIIIDIQNDYFQDGKMPLVGSLEASLKAKSLLQYFREQKLPVIHIQHLSAREDATFFIQNTKGVEIHDNVKPLDSEPVVQKYYPNSFRDTNLKTLLDSMQINDLVICGMMTSMCVDATTRAAKDLGYNCSVVSDACAAPNLQLKDEVIDARNVHNSFLAALSFFYATVITFDEFLKIN